MSTIPILTLSAIIRDHSLFKIYFLSESFPYHHCLLQAENIHTENFILEFY